MEPQAVNLEELSSSCGVHYGMALRPNFTFVPFFIPIIFHYYHPDFTFVAVRGLPDTLLAQSVCDIYRYAYRY